MTDPILIAGAGPTGLTAALELSRMGVAVRLIDKRDAPATTSRHRRPGAHARTLRAARSL
jgi:2-polyprenyl-6-methoxyphenol hydroxylase-like FAD-dependent oxidoreductase